MLNPHPIAKNKTIDDYLQMSNADTYGGSSDALSVVEFLCLQYILFARQY